MKTLILTLYILFISTIPEDINTYRTSINLQTLKEDKTLSEIAQRHSEYMFSKKQISHDNFQERVKGRDCGECVSRGTEKPLSYWLKSVGHKKIIEGNYSKIGIGNKEGYITIILEK
jgi:uncharacterized protein YkwD